MILGFSHAQLVVENVDVTATWYEQVLGMDVFARGEIASGPYVALRHPSARFVIGMQTATPEQTGGSAIDHLSFAVADRDDLDGLRARLLDAGIEVGAVFDEAVSHNLRATDPDGLVIEFTAPRR